MNAKKLLTVLFLLLASMFFSGCAPHQAYRSIPIKESCNGNKCKQMLIENHTAPDKSYSYDLGFIEFTERGNLFSRGSLDKVLKHIETEKNTAGETGIMVLVYVHGWKHNASNDPGGDVRKFRKLLKIVDKNKVAPNRKTIGIYIGWRGLASMVEPAKTLSYWGRKNIAHQVGSGGVSEVLLRLERIVKTNNGRPLTHNNNIFSMAGHSFGAAVILSATKDILLNRIVNAKLVEKKYCTFPAGYTYDCKRCYETEGFGDGITLLNPAVEANEIVQIKELVSEQRCYSRRQSKLLNIVSSERDWATKSAFVLGQILGVSLRNHEEELERKIFDGDSSNKKDITLKELHLDTRTAGHYAPFRTGLIKDGDEGEMEKFIACHGKGKCVDESSKLKKKNFPVSPYEPVSIDYIQNNYMKGHNDIFNAPVVSYMATSIMRNKFHASDGFKPSQGNLKSCLSNYGEKWGFDFGRCKQFFMCRYEKGFQQEFGIKKPLPFCK